MADDIRVAQQSIFDGRDGVFEVFQLKSNSSLEIIGIEHNGWILYFIDNNKRNHMGYVIGVLPDQMQDIAQSISELSQGYFKSFAENCRLWAQYIQDGIELRFDRTAIVNVEGKWQFWKSITYNDIDATWFDIIANVGTEYCESITQLCNELSSWNGFSIGDNIRSTLSDLFAGYKKVRKYISFSGAVEDIF